MSFTTLSDEEERELYRLSGLRLRLRLGVGMFLVRPAPAVAVQEKFRNALPHFAGQRHLRIRVVNDESARLHFAIFLVLTEEQRRADTGISRLRPSLQKPPVLTKGRLCRTRWPTRCCQRNPNDLFTNKCPLYGRAAKF